MEAFAYFMAEQLKYGIPAGQTLVNIAKATDRYAMYKVGPVLALSVSIPQAVIHSFIPNISRAPLQVHYYSEVLPTTAFILCRSKHAEVLQATASEGLAQGPYVAAIAGFEPVTLWTQGTELYR